jgi:hypothetical protein
VVTGGLGGAVTAGLLVADDDPDVPDVPDDGAVVVGGAVVAVVWLVAVALWPGRALAT